MRAVERVLLALVAIDAATALAAWRQPEAAPRSDHRPRFRVLIPAHDEGHVVGALLGDLADQRYPTELVDVVVLADRCTDATADVAAAYAARALERREGSAGKGPALAWSLRVEPLRADEVLLVLDADNRVGPDTLSMLADELASGADALQCYLDVEEPDENWLTMASALSYWSGNRLTQVARRNLGLSADLGGTGMCLTPRALEAAAFGSGLSEDRELAIRLVLAGIDIRWVHHVRVRDEKPRDLSVAVRQRSRWGRGLDEVRRAYLPALVHRALRHRDPSAADFALRLVRPSRTTVLLSITVLLAARAVGQPAERSRSLCLLPLLGLQALLPPLLLLREGVPARQVVRYPVAFVLPVLSLLGRATAALSSHPSNAWYHTPHRGGRRQVGSEAPPTA